MNNVSDGCSERNLFKELDFTGLGIVADRNLNMGESNWSKGKLPSAGM